MNLPILMQKIYGVFTFTGLYSFEFVDKNRNTITEVFLMSPPKSKNVSEPTRSSTVPTIGGNYVNDAGNGTKNITVSGELFFPYVGSPDNPVAKNPAGLENTIDGFSEFFKLRWMLVRYRDYTMTRNAEMTVPTSVIALSSQINALYKKVARNVKEKTGALYNEVQLIIHDYDMDDHFYCRINNFSSTQSADRHTAIQYTIDVECHEPDFGQKPSKPEIKKTTNEAVDITNEIIQSLQFDTAFTDIQAEIGYNASFVSTSIEIEEILEQIDEENTLMQSGESTALNNLPTYVASLLEAVDSALDAFIDTFLSSEQQTDYMNGDETIDDLVNSDVFIFYNTLQKVKMQAESLRGILNSIVQQEEIRYYTNSDDYTLSEEQFDSGDENKVENNTTFYYYTVMEGDTARIVAQRELKDSEKYISILRINEITENDFIDGSIIGQKIKIPLNTDAVARGEDNLVYESDTDDLDAFLYGSDIALDISDSIQVSPTGDLLSSVGIENVYDSIENRIVNLKGSLNVFNTNWGTISIDDSNAPLMVKIDRYLSDVVSQIQSDPRVESVKMDLDRLVISGESISVPSKIFFIGTDQFREVTT